MIPKLLNQIEFMRAEMTQQQRTIVDLRVALAASQETTTSLIRYVEPTNPILASRLRCLRVGEECRQLRRARLANEESERESKRAKREQLRLVAEASELGSRAERVITGEFRGSARALAAENVKLRAQLIMSGQYIKNECVECLCNNVRTMVEEEISKGECVSQGPERLAVLLAQQGEVDRTMPHRETQGELDV